MNNNLPIIVLVRKVKNDLIDSKNRNNCLASLENTEINLEKILNITFWHEKRNKESFKEIKTLRDALNYVFDYESEEKDLIRIKNKYNQDFYSSFLPNIDYVIARANATGIRELLVSKICLEKMKADV